MEDGPSQSIIRRLQSLFRRLRNGYAPERFEEEIQGLIDQGAEHGAITPGEGEMITSIMELGDTVAREVMVPRTSMEACPVDAPLGETIEIIIQNGYSRIPIYEQDIDHIVGILHAKDLLTHWGLHADAPIPREIIRPPIFVPETKRIADLLTELRTLKSHMAIILDEYGGTAGLITLEDIIEEIIGEIQDEYDMEEDLVIPIDEDTSLVDARINIEDLETELGIQLPQGEYETVGGFITDLIGRVPREKEKVEFNDLLLTIHSADERKINQVEIKRLPQPGARTGSD